MEKNNTKQLYLKEMKQLLDEILPIYMQIELKNNKKPVMIGSNFTIDKTNEKIQNRFPSASIDLITQEKLDKIYEGIVDIVRSDKETAMIFKNTVDIEIVKMYFYPQDLKEAGLIQTNKNINIIILIFNQE